MATKETIKRRDYQRKHHIDHREEFNERSRQWYYENREKVLTRHRERMSTDPEYAEKIRAKDRRTYKLRQIKKRREMKLKAGK